MIRHDDDDDAAQGTGGFGGATGIRAFREEEAEEVGPAAAPGVVPEASVEVVPAASDETSITGTIEGAKRWVQAAQRFAQGKVACQIMAGFELLELRRTYGFVQGGLRGRNPKKSGFATWQEFLRGEIGISDDTARAWCRMAEAVRPRLRKLPGVGELFRELLKLPIAQLSVGQIQLLSDAVHRIADGRTQLEFELEMGLAKAPQGSAAKGGNLGGGRPARGAADVSAEAQEQIARDDWTAVGQKLQIARASFVLLRDEEIDALIAAMTATLAGMRQWRQAPKALRDDALVREVTAVVEG